MTTAILTPAAFDRARQFIEQQGRPIDRARFYHAFDGASLDGTIAALKGFQNADGGFGHGLEPDLRTPTSSVLCTSIAFQAIRSAKVDLGAIGAADEMVRAAMGYLLDTFDAQEAHWPIIPGTAQDSPRAPWWDRHEDGEAESFSLNPTAEILGYVYDYQQWVPSTVLEAVSQQVMATLGEIDEIEMHDLLCCLRLLQTQSLPKSMKRQLQEILGQHIRATVEQDPGQWSGYCLRPLQVIDDPGSPFMTGMEAAIAANLDYEIGSQAEDGAWKPTWSWGDRFPEAWEQAKQDWSGAITMETLLLLQQFGRIEGK